MRAGAGARDRGVPHAPQPEDARGKGVGVPRQPPPAPERRAQHLDGRASQGSGPLVGIVRGLRGSRVAVGPRGVAARPARPRRVPRIAPRPLPRLRVAVHRGPAGDGGRRHPRRAPRGLDAGAAAGERVQHGDHRQPGADVHLPWPAHHGHHAARRTRARRPEPGDRVLRAAPRPARASDPARGERHPGDARGVAPRQPGRRDRPRGQNRREPGRAVPGGHRGGDEAGARPGAHDQRGQHRDRAAADRPAARRIPGRDGGVAGGLWGAAAVAGENRGLRAGRDPPHRRHQLPGQPRHPAPDLAPLPGRQARGRRRPRRVPAGERTRRDREPHSRLQRHGEQDPRAASGWRPRTTSSRAPTKG